MASEPAEASRNHHNQGSHHSTCLGLEEQIHIHKSRILEDNHNKQHCSTGSGQVETETFDHKNSARVSTKKKKNSIRDLR